MGLLVAAVAVIATTLAIYPLAAVSPPVSLGVLYLLAVLLVSTYWGLWLGVLTAVMSTATFNFFHIAPTGQFHIAESQNWVALGVFLVAAVTASTVAGAARMRATDAHSRRQEADLAAAMAGTLLRGARLDEAVSRASDQLAAGLGLAFAAIELAPCEPGERRLAIPLRVGPGRDATLLIPADVDEGTRQRLTERVVPSLEALLTAALDRDLLQREVVETQALRRSDVLKTALLRAVSHDLRSPLTAIIAAGDAVASPTVEPAERQDLAAMVVGEAKRLSHMVEQLLDLSRLQAEAAPPRRDWCSLEEILASAIDHLEARNGGVPIATVIEAELPFIEADAAQLERVFVNLLENACRFSDGDAVEVRAEEADGRVTVRVVDGGPGIPEHELPHIFEPFHRGETDRGHPGSGLGLAIVKGLVEANGGVVHAGSRPGRGAVFSVAFPAPDGAARRAMESGTR